MIGTVKDCIKDLQDTNKPESFVLLDVWYVEDVMQEAEDMGFECDEEKAKEILVSLNNNHDACLGINWEVIGHYIDYHCEPKEE